MGFWDWVLVIAQAGFGLFSAWVALSGFYAMHKAGSEFEDEFFASLMAFVGSVSAASCFALLPWTVYMISG